MNWIDYSKSSAKIPLLRKLFYCDELDIFLTQICFEILKSTIRRFVEYCHYIWPRASDIYLESLEKNLRNNLSSVLTWHVGFNHILIVIT